MPKSDPTQRLLGLLGLARRAGKLAVGTTAVRNMCNRGGKIMIIIARDVSPGQKSKLMRLTPPENIVDDLLDRADMATALGREDLTVVAVQDRDFLKGIRTLLTGP